MSVSLIDLAEPRPVHPRVEGFLEGLPGPTVLRLPGLDPSRVRVVGGTLHGNEPSGIRAIHRALREGLVPQTDVLLVVGGVEAARTAPTFSFRSLPGRRDPNRCFRPPWDGVDGENARDILTLIEAHAGRLELAVDLHNNTGRNPAYSLGLTDNGAHLSLATLFAPRFIHSRLRVGSFHEALARWCPSVTVECGQAHDPAADAVAWLGLRRLFQVEALHPDAPPEPMELFHSAVRVEVAPGCSLAFARSPSPAVDVTIDGEVDRHNFHTLRAGTPIGWVRPGMPWPLRVLDESGERPGDDLFTLDGGGALRARVDMVPIMMTTHPGIARSDCLFYVVQRTP